VSDAEATRTSAPGLGAPWGRGVFLANLCVFAIPAIQAWQGASAPALVLVPLALALSGLAGVVLVLRRVSRPTGVRVLAATVLVALLEVALTFALILAYSGTHPGWDLS